MPASAPYRAPLPMLAEDTLPAGDRIDVIGDDFFVFKAGDRAVYLGTSRTTGASLEVVREVTEGPDAQGSVTITESVPAQPGLGRITERWVRTNEGWATPEALGVDAPMGVRNLLSQLLLYPLPFYPAGSERVVVRQGPLGQDLDGDGRDESFRFEYHQTFVGFTSATRGGRPERRARFINRAVLTVQPSDPRFLVVTAETREEVVFASHTGQISAVRQQSGNAPISLAYDGPTTLLSGTLAGHDVAAAWNGGSVRYLPLRHHDLAWEPVTGRYYAGLSAADAAHPGAVARVDPVTGATAFSVPLGGDVRSIAVSADGSSLYAGVYGVPEIYRLSLPDLTVQQRIALPAGSWAFSLAVSPVDPDLIAYQLDGFDRLALARNGVLLPGTLGIAVYRPESTDRPARFSADGTKLYAFSLGQGLVALPLNAGGFTGTAQPMGFVLGRSLEIDGQTLVAGTRRFDMATDTLLGEVPADAFFDSCLPMTGGTRWACRASSSPAGVGVVTVDGFVPLADGPVPLPTPAPGGPSITRVVPGPAGQVAVMTTSISLWSEYLGLFDNPDFR